MQLLTTSICIFFWAGAALGLPSTITIPQGSITGTTRRDVHGFLGIPFAKPPVGPLRFAAPQPHPGWNGTLNCTTFGRACPQLTFGIYKAPPISEDCLFLNVWTPAHATRHSKLPVLIWIYGGAYEIGTTSNPAYRGYNLSHSTSMVVVSMNYRLNVFGFFSYPGLNSGDLNQGSQDQRLATKWVHDNIAYFGGDPNKVVLAGESAGSASVSLQILPEKIYFSAAIMESGGGGSTASVQTIPTANKLGLAMGKAVNCSTLACIRQVPFHTLLNATLLVRPPTGASFTPVLGGALLPRGPMSAMKSGKYNTKIPLLVGNVGHEGRFFALLQLRSTNLKKAMYETLVKDLVESTTPGANVSIAHELYDSLAVDGNYFEAYAAMKGDTEISCWSVAVSEWGSTHSPAVYRYEFLAWPVDAYPYNLLNDTHAADLLYVFDQPEPRSHRNLVLANAVATYWSDMAKNGEPNPTTSALKFGSLPHWPPYTNEDPNVMLLRWGQPKVVHAAKQHARKCAFWFPLLA